MSTLAAQPDGLSGAKHFWAAMVLGLGIAMSSLDGSIANLALPSLAAQFAVTPATSIWIVNAYQLALTVSLLALAALGEVLGYRRVYCGGIVLFTLASLGCGLSANVWQLIAARAAQGLGAAGMMSVNGALVRFVYPSSDLGRGFSMNVMVGSAASTLGPSLAAFILAVANWHWLFAINVPVGMAALLIGMRTLPETPRGQGQLDVLGMGLSALTFGLLITGIETLGHRQAAGLASLELIGAITAGLWLVRRERDQAIPFLPIDLLRHPWIAFSVAASTCSFAAQSMGLVTIPFTLMHRLHFGRGASGLLMAGWPLAALIVSSFSSRLSERFSPAIVGGLGQACMATGLVALAFASAGLDSLGVVWRIVLCGIGFGLFNAPNNRAMFAFVPRQRSGGASGLQATSRLLGQTGGTAVVALVFSVMPAFSTSAALCAGAMFSIIAGLASVARNSGRR